MRKNKTWTVDLIDRSSVLESSNVEQGQNDEFWTNDTEAYLNFKPNHDSFEFTEAELTMYNKNDSSLVVLDSTDGVMVDNNVVSYEMQSEVIAHFGKWTVQVRFIQADNESFTSGIIEYEVKRALGDAIPERLSAMKSWDTFFTHAQETIALMEEAELTRAQAELDRQAQEEASETAESQREANEEERKSNESERIESEDFRGKAEEKRQSTFEENEQTRQMSYEEAESGRDREYAARVTVLEEKTGDARNSATTGDSYSTIGKRLDEIETMTVIGSHKAYFEIKDGRPRLRLEEF